MNILIFNWRDPKSPKAGGAEIVTQEYAKAWVKTGHTVTWFSSTFEHAKNTEIIDGVKIIRRGGAIFDVQIKAFLWYIFTKHEKFDLIIDQFHGIPFFTPLYAHEKKLAFIHEVAKDVWKLNPWPKPFNLIPYFIGTFGEPFMFKTIYRNIPFLTVSQSTKNDLIAWGIPSKNITIIYNGTNAPIMSAIPQKEKKKTVILLGAISEDKGIKDAMQVFAALKRKDPNYQFWVVGKGDDEYMQQLDKMSNILGIKNDITFWGYVDEKKKYSLLSKAHLLLHPSIREGWGLVVIEAASQATPSIVYNVPGLKDSVQDGETGIIVKNKNPEEMAKEILLLLHDEKKYKRFQSNCLKWAKRFDWGSSLKESIKLIETV
jgi:glycosyltransferase involved in cell wall biosynthesis